MRVPSAAMSLHALSRSEPRTPSDEAARILLRAHLDARSYRPCLAAAPALEVPDGFRTDADLYVAAALAVAETFGLLEPAARAQAAATLVRQGLDGEADTVMDGASPEQVLAWCTAAAEWCERNGLDREFGRLQARAAVADAHPAAPAWLRVHWRVAAAWHHETFGRRSDVSTCLEQAQEIAGGASDIGLQVVVWLKRAQLALSRETPSAALALAERAAAHADETSSPLWLADVADVTSRAALRQGDMHRALHQARRAVGLADLAQACPAYTFTYQLNEAYALLGLGAWDEAVKVARELARLRLPAWLVERVEHFADLAILIRDDRTDAWTPDSTTLLGHCVRRQRELGWPGILALMPELVARLWARALEEGVEPDWIRASIRSRDLPPPEPAWPSSWPWALRVTVLGPFSCMVGDGTPVGTEGAKASLRPMALLRRVAAEGGYDGVSADRVAQDLWPGDGREGREKALETTLARLRRLLGHADAVLLQERRLRLNPKRVWLDSAALARLLRKLEMHSSEEQTPRAVALWREAITLYRGPLLADQASEPWLEVLRKRQRADLAAALLHHELDPAHRMRCLAAASADPEMLKLL